MCHRAADIVLDDGSEPEAREALIRGVLIRTIDATGYLTEAEEAVAAAELVAAQCPGGEPVDMSYGPETPMRVFPPDLRALAGDEDGLASNRVGPSDCRRVRESVVDQQSRECRREVAALPGRLAVEARSEHVAAWLARYY
ncbi:DUF4259 domain-containing protein [Streptomyces sp. NPDC059218]|uniref:DUF4259 domain-containing protein n=1 Tax=unclassified Streptomyces TaxID=2593676 RepID=UPI003673E33B